MTAVENETSRINLHEDVDVELVQHVGGDASVVQSARVSLAADNPGADFSASTEEIGLINYLMREHHGTPFEHNSITFRVRVPIAVAREWHRHRVQSYNETSGRYTELAPEFYWPSVERPLVNVGTSAKPQMAPAEPHVTEETRNILSESYLRAWDDYQDLLALGIAKEVARLVLPVGIMTTMYATANLRAWMHFIALRTYNEDAVHVSRPQREIEMAAEKIEKILTGLFPVSMESFRKHGRVAP